MRGLRTKVVYFYNTVSSSNYNIIALTETWLSDDILSSELFSQDFCVFHSDRNLDKSGISRGGGILIAIRGINTIYFLVDFSNILQAILSVDVIGVGIRLNSSQCLYIVNVYITPTIAFDAYNLFFNVLGSYNFLHVVILGDFNTPNFGQNIIDKYAIVLNNFNLFLNIKQRSDVVNHQGRLLDLVLSNLDCQILRSNLPLVVEDSYHPALTMCIFA